VGRWRPRHFRRHNLLDSPRPRKPERESKGSFAELPCGYHHILIELASGLLVHLHPIPREESRSSSYGPRSTNSQCV
jgi:hypothetical protein